MPTYYVHIPNSEAPTAEIEASSTKHARTTYLDYLSRNDIIGWRDRQTVRKLIKVSRMQPGEIRTQVKLEYDLVEEPTKELATPPEVETPEDVEEEPDYDVPTAWQFHKHMADELLSGEPPSKTDPFGGSPIVRLSRKSRGM